MKTLVRVRTKVLPGNRIEISDPNLPEGASVEVVVAHSPEPEGKRINLYEWLRARPPQPKPRGAVSWEEYEQLIQQERDAWE